METTLILQLKPFPLPTCVQEKRLKIQEKDDPNGGITLPLGRLDSRTLNKLCNEFTNSVFTVADVPQLPQLALAPTNINDALADVPGLSDAVEGLLDALRRYRGGALYETAREALVEWDKARQ